jgi:hypothetical protein
MLSKKPQDRVMSMFLFCNTEKNSKATLLHPTTSFVRKRVFVRSLPKGCVGLTEADRFQVWLGATMLRR